MPLLVHAHSYAPHDELSGVVRAALRRRMLPGTWRIGRRAASLQAQLTDFVVLEVVGASAHARAERLLLRDARVDSVTPQHRYHGLQPLALRGGPGGGGGGGGRPSHDYVTTSLNASHWWARGATGGGVRIAIFDTGLNSDHRRFLSRTVEMIDFTDERTTDDRVGHSTFITGTIASQRTCLPRAGAEQQQQQQ